MALFDKFNYFFPDRLLQVNRYWSSFLLYQLCVFFQLYFYLDSIYGVIFVESFLNLFFRTVTTESSVT